MNLKRFKKATKLIIQFKNTREDSKDRILRGQTENIHRVYRNIPTLERHHKNKYILDATNRGSRASLGAHMVKNLPAMWETRV